MIKESGDMKAEGKKKAKGQVQKEEAVDGDAKCGLKNQPHHSRLSPGSNREMMRSEEINTDEENILAKQLSFSHPPKFMLLLFIIKASGRPIFPKDRRRRKIKKRSNLWPKPSTVRTASS